MNLARRAFNQGTAAALMSSLCGAQARAGAQGQSLEDVFLSLTAQIPAPQAAQ